nr:TatD family hydrolase [Chloroflexota bacterium]
MDFIDTHAHLDDTAFDRDRDEVIARAVEAGVIAVCNVGYRPSRWNTTADLAATFSIVTPMYGLHPQHADELSDLTVEQLYHRLSAAPACAVGEIGLDFFRNGPPRAIQLEALHVQL